VLVFTKDGIWGDNILLK